MNFGIPVIKNLVPSSLSYTIPSSRSNLERLPKVKMFLESIGKNSLWTRKNYETSLVHLQDFLNKGYDNKYSLEDVLEAIRDNQINVYELIDKFVTHEMDKQGKEKLSPQSIISNLIGIKSYLAYYDIDIIPAKFKRKVKLPRIVREDEEPLDIQDIRRILLACNNRRLKAYILVLASGGLRAMEGLAIRLKDCNFSVSPTRISIRKEYAKTRAARDIYISDEATLYLKYWIEWKYRDKDDEIWTKKPAPDDLVFRVYTTVNQANPVHLYIKIATEFEKLLSIAGLDERKEGMKRRKITLHSLRRFTKTVISNQAGQDFSELILGHKKSVYYVIREQEKREIYATKCMKYLTFLDYITLEATGKNIEAKLTEKEAEFQSLRQKYDADIALLKEAIIDMQQLLKSPSKLSEIAAEV
ncbi:hypothetical protein BH18THE2_BH18THE2_21070 [soil metagenome]